MQAYNKINLPDKHGGLLLQPKLTVNAPGDRYEQEADAMADSVMRMPSPHARVKPITGLIGKSVQKKCAACEEEEKKIMRKTEGLGFGVQASPSLVSSINAFNGSGSSLPLATRTFMENAFSTDFSRVRVHTDAKASEMSKDINAKAFTTGSDIYFKSGEYNPDTSKGSHLLAHELTHVVQQEGRSSNAIQRAIELRPPGRGEASAFDRAQELIDRLNRLSTAIEYRLESHSLLYIVVDRDTMTNFDTQLTGFIDQTVMVPLRLVPSTTEVKGDMFWEGYVDLDDLMASDDLGFQSLMLHFLAERFNVNRYAHRIGTDDLSPINLTTLRPNPEFTRAHEVGHQAQVAHFREVFSDPSIEFNYEEGKPSGDAHLAFKSHTGHYRIFVIMHKAVRTATSRVRATSEATVMVMTSDGQWHTVEDFLQMRAAAAAPVVQPKLEINQPGDHYEQEADAMADRVMHLQSMHATISPIMCKNEGAGNGVQASSLLISSINACNGGGYPLPPSTRDLMENAFSTDFSRVRVHTDTKASEMSKGIDARAFTTGSDIYFKEGEYNPDNTEGRHLLVHELTHVVQQNHNANHSIQKKSGEGTALPLLIISGATFKEAAQNFVRLLKEHGNTEPARIVIINGSNLKVYNENAQQIGGNFRFIRPDIVAPLGVFRNLPGSGRALHAILTSPGGEPAISKGIIKGANIDFGHDIDTQQKFNKVLQGGIIYYVVPSSTSDAPPSDTPPPQENLPEVLKFKASGRANLPSWPAAVIPLTPQVTTINSTGSFVMRVEKNQGVNDLDRVTNLMEPTNFVWEVLKLENNSIKSTHQASKFDAVKQRYQRRLTQLEDDKQTLLGDRSKQSIPEQVVKGYIAEQVKTTRTALAVAGESVLTIIHALAGDTSTPNIEDFMDVPWREPGDYFVRCLATPVYAEDATNRRATSVGGATVSVFDIEEVASESLPTPEQERENAELRIKGLEQDLTDVDEHFDEQPIENSIRLNLLDLEVSYRKALVQAAGDPRATLHAELDYVNAQISFFTGPNRPSGRENEVRVNNTLIGLRRRQQKLDTVLHDADSRLGEGTRRTGMMSAVVVDEVTGTRSDLSFSIGERSLVSTDRLEIVIADVTDSHGGVFNGMGDGFLGRGRKEAWINAMQDMRQNLGRGRGWLSYRIPPPYATITSGLPNPMHLQVAPLDQVHEMVDDAAHAATLVALLAAPLTGGASLGVLAVLAPIQAASSLYNIVNRAAYDRLELDAEAIGDLINIASLGLGKVGTARQFATRGVQLVFTTGKVAARLLEAGGYIVLAYQTYQQITADVEGEDPREGRRRKLIALLSALEGASIPVATHLWPAGAHGAGRTAEEPNKKATPAEEKRLPDYLEHPSTTRTRSKEKLATLEAQIPADLRSKGVHILENNSLEGNTVRVHYDGDRLRVEIGPGAGEREVRLHIATMRQLSRYQGVLGRIVRIVSRIASLITRQPGYGTEGFEARLEIKKLNGIRNDLIERQTLIAERAERLNSEPGLSNEGNEIKSITDEIRSIEEQLGEHEANLNSFEEGRGFIAAEDRRTGAGESPPKRGSPKAKGRRGRRVRYPKAVQQHIEALERRFPKLAEAFIEPIRRGTGRGMFEERMRTGQGGHSFEAELRDGRQLVQLDDISLEGVTLEIKDRNPGTTNQEYLDELDFSRGPRAHFSEAAESIRILEDQMERQSQLITENGLPDGIWQTNDPGFHTILEEIRIRTGIRNIHVELVE